MAFRILLAALAFASLAALPARGADPVYERVEVRDPYLELRTGPGRAFPVFHVVSRGDSVEIELRHTDWFKVRTAKGMEGWVDRAQLERTLTATGTPKSFRDVLLDDYLHRRLEFGAGWGHFETDPVLKLWATYNFVETLAVEVSAGQVQGSYSGTNFWQIDMLVMPWSDKRLEPFFGVGVGRIQNVPNASLVNAVTTNANMANAMIGVRYHLTDKLIARLDWAAYTALIDQGRTAQYHALTGGLSFFF